MLLFFKPAQLKSNTPFPNLPSMFSGVFHISLSLNGEPPPLNKLVDSTNTNTVAKCCLLANCFKTNGCYNNPWWSFWFHDEQHTLQRVGGDWRHLSIQSQTLSSLFFFFSEVLKLQGQVNKSIIDFE